MKTRQHFGNQWHHYHRESMGQIQTLYPNHFRKIKTRLSSMLVQDLLLETEKLKKILECHNQATPNKTENELERNDQQDYKIKLD